MPEIVANHRQGVAFAVEHRGHTVVMDQPEDNGGADAGMTPPELFAASLAGCVGYYVARYCQQAGIDTAGLSVRCGWQTLDSPKRIGELTVDVDLPGVPEKRKRAVQRVAATCLLHATLTHPPALDVRLNGEPVGA